MTAVVSDVFNDVGGAFVCRAGTRAADERNHDNRAENDVSTSGDCGSVLQPARVAGNAAETSPQLRQHDTGTLHHTVAQRCRLLPRVILLCFCFCFCYFLSLFFFCLYFVSLTVQCSCIFFTQQHNLYDDDDYNNNNEKSAQRDANTAH